MKGYDDKDIIIYYVRNNRGYIKATLIAILMSDGVHVTWSQYKKEPLNQPSKAMGKEVAIDRLMRGSNIESDMPSIVKRHMEGFMRRIKRYFKGHDIKIS